MGAARSIGAISHRRLKSRAEEVTVAVKYTVVIERTSGDLAAYVPDLPGCVATGDTQEELLEEIREAIGVHIESLRDHGEPIPDALCTAAVVEVAAAV